MAAAASDREVILIDEDVSSIGSDHCYCYCEDKSTPIKNDSNSPSAFLNNSRGSGSDYGIELDQRHKDDSLSTELLSSSHRPRMGLQQQHCNPHDELVIDLQDHFIFSPDQKSSSSSYHSSSSGIPSPWKMTTNFTASLPNDNDCPPSIIHTTSSVEKDMVVSLTHSNRAITNTNRKPSKKKVLTNHNATICNEDDDDDDDETHSRRKEDCPPRRKGWNRKRGTAHATTSKPKNIHDDTSLSRSSVSIVTKSVDNDTANKHFHCYLLRSLDPDHPLKTYIGFTTHPERRIRQHNGILKNGGAHRTKRSGRPWTFVCVVHGFEDKITALQFEWAWQNVDKSKAYREALGGDDKLAKKMKRSLGPKARLEELRVLLKECLPFCLYSLTVYFPERYYHDIFSGILRRGKNGNPYKKDDDESDALFEPLMNIEVCSLENMPVAREAAQWKESKKARQEAKKSVKQQQKKKKSVANYESEISDWLEEKDSCWSDLLDDDDDDVGGGAFGDENAGDNDDADHDEDSSVLETINEIDLSIAQSDERTESDSIDSLNVSNNEIDDLSRGFVTLSMEFPEKQTPISTRLMKDVEDEDQISTLEDEASFPGAMLEPAHDESIDIGLSRDVIDLCDSPL